MISFGRLTVAFAALGLVAFPGESLSGEAPGAAADASRNATRDESAILAGLHPTVRRKIGLLRMSMEKLGRRVYLMSGARPGSKNSSLHNQALAVDICIDGMKSPQVASELRSVGFTCAISYYARPSEPCNMAHGDMRGTSVARGRYASGSEDGKTCPEMALSRTGSCDNDTKAQWLYVAKKRRRMAE